MDEQVRQEFVQRATEFLEANANRRVSKGDDFVWGEGPDNVRVMGSDDPEHENERLAAAVALYEQAGFRATGARRPLPTDPGHDAIELARDLA